MQREPAPEFALVSASGGLYVECTMDAVPLGLELSLWVGGVHGARLAATGFWAGMAGCDVFFEPRGVLFNRARFQATRALLATDPAPRSPSVWWPLSGHRGPVNEGSC